MLRERALKVVLALVGCCFRLPFIPRSAVYVILHTRTPATR